MTIEQQTPFPQPPAASPTEKPGPVGLGGWLILPLLGFIGTILLTGWNLVQAASGWSGLAAIFGAESGPLTSVKVPLAVSTVAGILVVFSAAYCLYLMFAKKRAIIKFATAHYLVLAAAGLLDLWAQFALEAAIPNLPPDPSGLKEAVRGVVIAGIWVPYFHLSKRVRNTFTA
jgi:hypothetical protein